ncbi:MAG: MarR family transcriptional regulator [Comamonadaceae bacterium]|nr:MAG: MarR family transcriptional regulator [Comamonadaceae bacterium]
MSKSSIRTEQTPAGHLAEARLQMVLGYQLAQAAIVTNAIYIDAAGAPFDLRPVEYTVLTLIAENPGGSLARLARALSVTAPNITVMIDRLEARGLVARAQSDQDRRTQVLHTTRKGTELVRKTTECIVAAEKDVLPLTTGEHAMLLELLHKVACARAGR